jgi:hypothetical protein
VDAGAAGQQRCGLLGQLFQVFEQHLQSAVRICLQANGIPSAHFLRLV